MKDPRPCLSRYAASLTHPLHRLSPGEAHGVYRTVKAGQSIGQNNIPGRNTPARDISRLSKEPVMFLHIFSTSAGDGPAPVRKRYNRQPSSVSPQGLTGGRWVFHKAAGLVHGRDTALPRSMVQVTSRRPDPPDTAGCQHQGLPVPLAPLGGHGLHRLQKPAARLHFNGPQGADPAVSGILRQDPLVFLPGKIRGERSVFRQHPFPALGKCFPARPWTPHRYPSAALNALINVFYLHKHAASSFAKATAGSACGGPVDFYFRRRMPPWRPYTGSAPALAVRTRT